MWFVTGRKIVYGTFYYAGNKFACGHLNGNDIVILPCRTRVELFIKRECQE
jgi:hypothetical protein